MQSNELLAVDASWTRGANTQKGKLLIRPQLAVFAPTEEKVNALAVAGVGLGLAFAGFSLRVVPGQYRDVASYVGALMQLPAAEFDAHLWPAARAAGWWIATPADSALLFKKTPLFDRFKCWVKRGNDNVGAVFGIPGAIARAAEPMLTAWPRA